MPSRERITDAANERATDEPITSTVPGIPDDAFFPGEQLPEEPSGEEVTRIAAKLGPPDPNQ